MNHLNWVINWFAAHGAAEVEVKEHLDENFFDLGYIDSFAFISLSKMNLVCLLTMIVFRIAPFLPFMGLARRWRRKLRNEIGL